MWALLLPLLFSCMVFWDRPTTAFLARKSPFHLSNRATPAQRGRAAGHDTVSQKMVHLSSAMSAQASSEGSDESALTLKEEIFEIVSAMVRNSMSKSKISGSKQPPFLVPPSLLGEFSHVLVQGRLYEEVINEQISDATSPFMVAHIEEIDSQMRAFITAERRSRTRLKLNYILAGATKNQMDQCIQMLHDSGELDRDLLIYLENLIKKELLKTIGPGAMLDYDDSGSDEKNDGDSMVVARKPPPPLEQSLVPGLGKDTIDVMRMVQRRIRAQQLAEAMEGAEYLKLLAVVIREEDSEERRSLLKGVLRKVEDLDAFHDFVTDGISYIKDTEAEASSNPNPNNKGTVLGPGTPERMQGVLLELDLLRSTLGTGLKDTEVEYSTELDEYD